MKFRTIAAAACISMAAMLPAGAATLVIDSFGQLLGAKDVEVYELVGVSSGVSSFAGPFVFNTNLIGTYDVSFVNGSCNTLFTNCDPTNGGLPFAFSTRFEAQAASATLLSTVFIDGSSGSFDRVPGLTRGCTSTNSSCNPLTPFKLNSTTITAFSASNNDTPNFDSIEEAFFTSSLDLTNSPRFTFAVWTPAAIVPLPAGLPLLLTGFAGLAGIRMLRKRRS